jgi:hypothetical protein
MKNLIDYIKEGLFDVDKVDKMSDEIDKVYMLCDYIDTVDPFVRAVFMHIRIEVNKLCEEANKKHPLKIWAPKDHKDSINFDDNYLGHIRNFIYGSSYKDFAKGEKELTKKFNKWIGRKNDFVFDIDECEKSNDEIVIKLDLWYKRQIVNTFKLVLPKLNTLFYQLLRKENILDESFDEMIKEGLFDSNATDKLSNDIGKMCNHITNFKLKPKVVIAEQKWYDKICVKANEKSKMPYYNLDIRFSKNYWGEKCCMSYFYSFICDSQVTDFNDNGETLTKNFNNWIGKDSFKFEITQNDKGCSIDIFEQKTGYGRQINKLLATAILIYK